MNAGLPGLGIGWLFVLFSALALPLRTLRGDRHAGRRLRATPLFALGVVMLVGTYVVWTGAQILFEAIGLITATGASPGPPMVVISLLILLVVVSVPEIVRLTVGWRPTPRLRAIKPNTVAGGRPTPGLPRSERPRTAERTVAEAMDDGRLAASRVAAVRAPIHAEPEAQP